MVGRYLITCDSWFVAPDGKQYQAVYGQCKVLSDSVLSIKTNAKSTNWFVMVGNDDKHIIIAGCQIHYAVKCERPNDQEAWTWNEKNGDLKKYKIPCRIYFPEDL